MIKVGEERDITCEFSAWSGIVRKVQLLKWGDYKKMNRTHKYVVFGTIFDDITNECKGCSPVYEGSLKDCRAFVNMYL